MRLPTYLYRRPDTGSFLFRWVVPAFLRPALGGKREIRRTLQTNDRRQALEAARKMSVAVERGALQVAREGDLNNPRAVIHLMLYMLEEFSADGKLKSRKTKVEIDPNKVEQEKEALDAVMRTLSPTNYMPAGATAAPGGMTLMDLVAAFFNEGVRAGQWTPKTKQELELAFSLMCEIIGGEKLVANLSRSDFSRFKDILQKLPRNKSKDVRFRGKTALELADMKIPSTDLMTVKTMNKYIERVSSLLKWGHIQGHLKANYAEGMALREPARKKEKNTKREPYTDTQVAQLLGHLLNASYDQDSKPWRKWVPLIGLYTGARLNEICQLHVADFQEVDGISYMSINDEGDGKKLKNTPSRRDVPIHPELVRLGLLDYVKALREKKVERLFPQLSFNDRVATSRILAVGMGSSWLRKLPRQIAPRACLSSVGLHV